MKKTALVLLTFLTVIAAIALPIWVAIEEARRQAFKAESAHALGYAREVVLRGDETAAQVRAAVSRLSLHAAQPCAPASIDLMRQIDLASTYIQAMGYVEGTRMLCSSIVGDTRALELGPVTYTSSAGAQVRTDVRFPFAPQESFLVVQSGQFAAILHGQLPLDTAKSEPDVALALIPFDAAQPLSVRGRIAPDWLQRLGGARERVFQEDGYLVAMVRSSSFRLAGIAAVPLRYMEERSQDVAARLVPAGVVAGIALSVAIFYIVYQQMSLPNAVRSALRRREFFVEYQPVAELGSGRWIGVEALVRWRQSTGGIAMPDTFIPIAEENDLIVQLTRQVLERVGQDTRAFLQTCPRFHVGINLAPADLRSPGLLGHLQQMLHHMGARPANLILEITERGMLEPDAARASSGNLRRHGFALAIDDFGTGYSSLSYLESLHLDYLKIDRSFIEAIGTGAPTSQVVGHIIRMAKDLGLRMIAEGVETQAQADFLAGQGVQYAQGWLFGRPMPFAEIVRQMEAQAYAPACGEPTAL